MTELSSLHTITTQSSTFSDTACHALWNSKPVKWIQNVSFSQTNALKASVGLVSVAIIALIAYTSLNYNNNLFSRTRRDSNPSPPSSGAPAPDPDLTTNPPNSSTPPPDPTPPPVELKPFTLTLLPSTAPLNLSKLTTLPTLEQLKSKNGISYFQHVLSSQHPFYSFVNEFDHLCNCVQEKATLISHFQSDKPEIRAVLEKHLIECANLQIEFLNGRSTVLQNGRWKEADRSFIMRSLKVFNEFLASCEAPSETPVLDAESASQVVAAMIAHQWDTNKPQAFNAILQQLTTADLQTHIPIIGNITTLRELLAKA